MDVGHGIFIGVFIGYAVGYFHTWKSARKIEALCKGGLKAWDFYQTTDPDAPTSSATGRTVTE
jgi:hypothetical protein